MILTELFNSKPKIIIDHDKATYISIHTIIHDKRMEFDADNSDGQGWWVTFSYPDADSVSASASAVFDLTGHGNALIVLAFVKSCLEILVARHNPSCISFSGSSKRSSVYAKMLTRFIPNGYKIAQDVRRDGTTYFTITK